MPFSLEAPPRFELGNEAFAELCLTAWPWRRLMCLIIIAKEQDFVKRVLYFCGLFVFHFIICGNSDEYFSDNNNHAIFNSCHSIKKKSKIIYKTQKA